MRDRAQELELQRLAVLNNAAWCVAMWRAHGLEVLRGPGLTLCTGDPPKYYPNAVTLDTGADPEAQVRFLERLAAQARPRGVSVKDSFQSLDLTGRGYRRLFEAQWMHRAPGAAGKPVLDWRLVEALEELALWEAAWRDEPVESQPIFTPALLGASGVGIFAGWRDGEIAAGVVLAPTDGVVGISNVFGDYGEAVAIAATVFSGAALVGYERGDDVQAARSCGFRDLGPLTVWVTV